MKCPNNPTRDKLSTPVRLKCDNNPTWNKWLSMDAEEAATCCISDLRHRSMARGMNQSVEFDGRISRLCPVMWRTAKGELSFWEDEHAIVVTDHTMKGPDKGVLEPEQRNLTSREYDVYTSALLYGFENGMFDRMKRSRHDGKTGKRKARRINSPLP